MTDEFYACKNCGAFEEGTHMIYRISGIYKDLTEEDMNNLCEVLGIDDWADLADYEEIEMCNACNDEYDGVCVASTDKF